MEKIKQYWNYIQTKTKQRINRDQPGRQKKTNYQASN